MSQGLINFSTYINLNPGLTVPYIRVASGPNAIEITPTTIINATGATGPVGPAGVVGAQGPRGYAGPSTTGPTGPSSSTGPTGSVGPTGQLGPTGADGMACNTGATGPLGPTGATGQTGDRGADGTACNTGATGPTGPLPNLSLGIGDSVLYNPTTSSWFHNSTLSITSTFIQSAQPHLVNQTIQQFSTLTQVSTPSINFDWRMNSVWTLSSISTNFNANFTNVPTNDSRSYVVLLNLLQAGYPYYASTVQVNNSTVTVRWANGTVPTPSANKVELESFTLFYVNGWITLGQYVSVG
jgi:hypothetical protein